MGFKSVVWKDYYLSQFIVKNLYICFGIGLLVSFSELDPMGQRMDDAGTILVVIYDS